MNKFKINFNINMSLMTVRNFWRLISGQYDILILKLFLNLFIYIECVICINKNIICSFLDSYLA